jgi:P-type Ca2+ transporter type 2C
VMTVRVVATRSGRVRLGGSGYQPTGEVTREGGGEIDEQLGHELRRALSVANRANNASVTERGGEWVVHGDPTEAALLVAARKVGLSAEELEARLPRLTEVPFSSERKLMSTIHRESSEGRLIVFSKGAPDVLLTRCTHEGVGDGKTELTAERRAEIVRTNESLADEALRTLALAAHWLPDDALDDKAPEESEFELVWMGLIGMMDPPRPEAAAAVAQAQAAGIRTLMITGDHPRTAAVIAQELGIARDGNVVTGAALARLSDAERTKVVNEATVYARVNPEDKLTIVNALRAEGAIVAMTGDGVNDAPALRTADIGVAMGIAGTDVSREAADIILMDDNFASIVAAVEEGRAIFSNIRKFLRYLLSSNIGEVLTMFAGVLLARRIGLQEAGNGVVLPLLATQLLWVNLVTDGAPALALGVDKADGQLMTLPPRPAGEPVITRQMWRGIAFVGAVMAIGTLFILDASLPGGFIAGTGDLAYAQTRAFTTLVLFQLFNVFNARSDTESAFRNLFRNRWLWGPPAGVWYRPTAPE